MLEHPKALSTILKIKKDYIYKEILDLAFNLIK